MPKDGRCAIFGFVFLGQKNHKMHIAHLERFGAVGRCQSCATPPHLLDNLHFEHVDNYFNLHMWLTRLSKCSKKNYAPQTKIWKDEQKMKSGFSTVFSMVRSPNRVLMPLKKCFLRNPHFICCFSSQNLRLGGVNFRIEMEIF